VRKRYFTLAQANALISRVRPRIERMMQLSVHLRAGEAGEAGQRPTFAAVQTTTGATLLAGATLLVDDPVAVAFPANAFSANAFSADTFAAEAFAAEAFSANDEDSEQQCALTTCLYEVLSDELKGIERLGAEVKNLGSGLTAFPSFLEGSVEVLLAWTVTDAEIRTFYTPQGGYRTRKPIEGCRFTDGRTPTGQLRE
jgi:hypothetical protein